jgi:hypothetical protein
LREYLQRAAFARLAGVSSAAITKAATEGRVVEARKGIDPSDPVNALFIEKHHSQDRRRSGSAKPAREGESKKGGRASIYAARIIADTALKVEQAATHRQRRLERLGILVLKEQTDQRMAIMGNEIKTRFLEMPARIFPQLAALIKSGREEDALAKLEAEISEAIARVKEKARA